MKLEKHECQILQIGITSFASLFMNRWFKITEGNAPNRLIGYWMFDDTRKIIMHDVPGFDVQNKKTEVGGSQD